MANRLQANTRLWVYRFLVERDGEFCQVCGKTPAANNSRRKVVLEIDHKDNNSKNWETGNLQILCKACNVGKENKRRAGSSAVYVWATANPMTRISKQVVDYKNDAPATMQANALFENDFRSWACEIIARESYLMREDAINGGAEVIGCSPATTERYLKKLTSRFGILVELKDMLGNVALKFKPEYEPTPEPK